MAQVPGTGFETVATIRDQLYDRIPMAAEELALIQTPPFLRLERIQQLGFASRVWPGARHTRFEHSLGVLYLARRALAHLRARPGGEVISTVHARTLAAAALLHDIGHYPYSHAIEELGDPIVPHERVGRRVITSQPIARVLRDRWDVEPERVAAIVDPHGHELDQVDRLLRVLLSGPLDVDKMDYLPRDARACAVPYGGVDTERLIDSLEIREIGGKRTITVGEKGVSPTHSLINARQEMFDNVYWHHTNRASMAMLLRAVQEALLAGAVSAGDLTAVDDAELLNVLAGAAMPEITRRLQESLRLRTLHKRALEVSSRAGEVYARLGRLYPDPARRRAVENRMVDLLNERERGGYPYGSILIDIPKPERWRTDVWVSFRRPPLGFEPVLPWRDVAGLTDDDLKRYEEHRRLIRIVTVAGGRETVGRDWESIVLPALEAE